jgi:peptidoglycan L-alanyl-D-glutamate endopeptidase CwlK
VTYAFGARSLKNMEGLHPDVIRVLNVAIASTEQDFMVLEGSVRTREQMCINYGKGRTASQCTAKGVPAIYAKPNERKVTWLRNPFASKHALQVDGFSHAVDIVPFPVDWNDISKFDAMGKAMIDAAKLIKVGMRWGADWDQDGKLREKGETDSPHFELT